jgi:hypothetical protein
MQHYQEFVELLCAEQKQMELVALWIVEHAVLARRVMQLLGRVLLIVEMEL